MTAPKHLACAAAATALLLSLHPLAATPWTYSASGSWPPPSSNLLAVPSNEVPMDAQVQESPARIDLRFFQTGTFKIYRKDPATVGWGTPIATATASVVPTVWSDTGVVAGTAYEYGVGSVSSTYPNYYGNILAGIKVDRTQPPGRIALVVASEVPAQLPAEYAQYKADLTAEGWVVHEILTSRAKDPLSNNLGANVLSTVTVVAGGTGYTYRQDVVLTNSNSATALATLTTNTTTGVITSVAIGHSAPGFTVGQPLTMSGQTSGSGAALTVATVTSSTVEHVNIRNQLIALYNTYPSELKNVVLIGKVPVVRSGIGYTGPDGHGNRASVGADAYYADMDGVWNDTGNNLSYYPWGGSPSRTDAIADGRINIPGDNKYDPTYLSQVTNPNSRVELGFGRIDFSNDVPGEYEALRTYFDKLHRYKTAAADFRPGRIACNRMNAPPTGDTVQTAMLRGMPPLLGMEQIQFVTNTEAVDTVPPKISADEDRDSAYTRQAGPFLFYFKGSGPPDWSPGGQAVFWTGLQSHWGYWFIPNDTSGANSMQRRLAEENLALSFTWSIWGTDFLYHRLGMGGHAGEMMRLTMNDRTGTSPAYPTTSTPTALFMNHMGCPSLRPFMFEPPGPLSVWSSGGNPTLSWAASPATGVLGYHVYRAADAAGPFARITAAPVAGTSYTDTSVNSGGWHYQVKAVRLESTGGGTFYNASLAVSGSVDLTGGPSPLAVATAALPDASWQTDYLAQLVATGGTPQYTWSLQSGALPPGLSLSPSGAISGQALAEGTSTFTVQAEDQLGQTAQKSLTLAAGPNRQATYFAEANSYCTGYNTTKWAFREPSLKISGPLYLYQAFLRFNLNGLAADHHLARAKLVLTVDERSQPNSYALLKTAFTQDAGQDWTESGLTYATRPLDDTAVAPVDANAFAVPFGTVAFDVTEMVRATLANDPAKKVGLRIFTNAGNAFGNEVRVTTRYAPGNAGPRLVLETSDAPAITITSPTVNPASVHLGSSLLITATASAIPENAGALAVQWSQASGPGTATFAPATQASTAVSFPASGDYVLRLTANDGVLSSYKDLAVRVLSVPATTAPAHGPAGSLILRLPFDEGSGTTAADFSGVTPANDGTLATIGTTGNPSWVSVGRIGAALNFDGTGQRVEVEDSTTTPLDGMQQMSLSLWLKLNAADAASHAAVSKRTGSTSTTTSYMLQVTGAEKLSATIYNKTAVTGDNILNVGQWYHVAMVFDGTLATNNLQLYLNGSPEKFGTVTGLTNNSIPRITSKFRVGDYINTAMSGSTSLGFNGQIDEVRLYNRALTLAEIQDLAKGAPSHMGPRITLASSSVSGTAGQPVALAASVADDGLPGSLGVAWQKAAGPANVVFSAPFSASTDATASGAGAYTLRLTASDGSITTYADVAASFAAAGGIESWRQLHFGTTENSGEAADDANPAKDGLPNLLKYAMGLNPHVNYSGTELSPHGAVRDVGGGERRLTLTFTRDTAVADATLTVEAGNDLAQPGWSGIDPLDPANQVEVLENTPAVGLQTITVKDTQAIGASERRFMRMKSTRP